MTDNVDFYNILLHNVDTGVTLMEGKRLRQVFRYLQMTNLSALMNGPVKLKLGIPSNVTWGGKCARGGHTTHECHVTVMCSAQDRQMQCSWHKKLTS